MIRFQVIVFAQAGPAGGSAPLPVTFDHALAELSQLPRLFIEPDGSFVWRGTHAGGGDWQVDGNLIDRGDVLGHVELKGSCPVDQFDQLLVALGWPEQALVLQLPRRGVILEEAEFRRLAATEAGAI